MDSQAQGDKPVVDAEVPLEPGEADSPISEGELNILANEVKELTAEVLAPTPPAGKKRYREPERKFLTRPANGRFPFTSEKFDLVRYANKVLYGYSRIYVGYIFKCVFVCNDKRGYATHFRYLTPKDMLDKDNSGYTKRFEEVRKEGRPVFGLLRLVWPSPTQKEIHHIIPYFVNGSKDKPTIWFLEQYDTTFWWLFNKNEENPDVAPRNWHNVVGKAMIGEGTYIRAYVGAAAKLSEKRTYKDGVAKGLEGYAMDLQRYGEESAETCVPWSMVMLKYIADPKTIGVDKPQLHLETMGQVEFDEMYKILNGRRDTVLKWVEGTVAGGKRRTRRRRRQTRRKTKRSRK
jgi:hypothetical protein